MSVSPFDHPVLSGLLGDPETVSLLSFERDLAKMLRFEAALAGAEAELGVIPATAATAISTLCGTFVPDTEDLKAGVGRDGVVVPALVSQMRGALAEAHRPHLHFGATSQDVIDTSLVLRLKAIVSIFDERLAGLIAGLEALAEAYGTAPIMGRTRMQDALPITVGDRITDWLLPLERHRTRLQELGPRLAVVQFGGAVGTLGKLGDKGAAVRARLAARLDLDVPEKAWHSQRDAVAELASSLAMVSGSLGKIGQDIALMAQNSVGEIRLAGGGGSSAMPHKSNPVSAEILVSLARHNATLLPGCVQAMVHEQERSGAAWTLEWLTLPQMVMTTGSGLLLADRLFGAVERLGRDASTGCQVT